MINWWITNVSDMNVCLADLGITVPAGRSWNLLDKKHFQFKVEDLERSRAIGSINKKRDKIKTGITHQQIVKSSHELAKQPIQTRKRSAVKITESKYDDGDWLFSDEEHAEEMSKDE
ncbi:hypothetical protein LCGC14_0959350 [marine sediment metagenome]|uniref:Uncharacterized protein n=1 Tax=marine sediment metagenome TaxID=412755 RepID=A0A0F9QY68_9ZZZZ